MSLKRIFGTVLTTLGIAILLYGAYAFIAKAGSESWKPILVALVLGTIFFGSGIGLVKGTADE